MSKKVIVLSGAVLLIIIILGIGVTSYLIFLNPKPPINKAVKQNTKSKIISMDEALKQLMPNSTDNERALIKMARSTSAGLLSTSSAALELAKKAGQKTSVIENNNCMMKPLVAVLEKGSAVEIKNIGRTNNVLNLNNKDYQIASGSAKITITNLPARSGLFPYKCDLHGVQGFIYIP